MTIHVYHIIGHKGSVCREDAYSVVQDQALLDIVPARDLQAKGLTPADLRQAFTAASQGRAAETPSARQAIAGRARRRLGL